MLARTTALPRATALALAAALALPLAARADEEEAAAATPAPEVEVDLDAAKKFLTGYLEQAKADPKKLKAKKWDALKADTHPKAMAKIEEIKKRTRIENHGLAWWAKAAEYVLTAFTVGDARKSGHGSVVIKTTEDHFSIEDQGDEPGIEVEYLVIFAGGRFWVADRRLGSNVFADDAIAASYKGWFDGEFEVPKPPAKKKGK